MTSPAEQAGRGTMRAVEYDRYGGSEVLRIREVERPRPNAGEVLIRVHGTSVNPIDVAIRSGAMRVLSGRRFPKRTCRDFTGEVIALGRGVTDLQRGQRIWGFLTDVPSRTGAAAEYLTVRVDHVSAAPSEVDLIASASLPSVGVTALHALRDVLLLAPDDRVLVVGASGGVGSIAIQLGVALGAEVTAVAGPLNHAFCTALGASRSVDYNDLRGLTGSFDAVLDCHGTALATYRRLLGRNGRMLTLATRGIGYAIRSMITPGPRVRIMMARPRRADLAALAEYVDRAIVRPVVQGVHPLEDTGLLHELAATGHGRGKRVIAVLSDDRPVAPAAAGDPP